MRASEDRETWGILGGMGPLASAEFMRTIYEESLAETEQESPLVVMLSDPAIPDRTECLLSGREDILMEHFQAAMGRLINFGVTRVVVPCLTIHPLIPRLPESWQRKIVSLVDVTLTGVLESNCRHLLLCTNGARNMGLFDRHELREAARDKILQVSEDDQEQVHRMIYEIKSRDNAASHIPFVEGLLARYGVTSYIAGCTELHIFVKEHQRATKRNRREFCIDPLTLVCSQISKTRIVTAATA